ncbi:hypothetical protein JCM12294_02080 [Desulfocicer niacini]
MEQSAHSELKAISPFALPVVKKRRLFEDKPARSSCALGRQGKWAADGPGPAAPPVGGGIMPFSFLGLLIRWVTLGWGQACVIDTFVENCLYTQLLVKSTITQA